MLRERCNTERQMCKRPPVCVYLKMERWRQVTRREERRRCACREQVSACKRKREREENGCRMSPEERENAVRYGERKVGRGEQARVRKAESEWCIE